MLQTPNPPNAMVYQAFRQTFIMGASMLRVSCSARDGRLAEQRELHMTGTAESRALKNQLGSLVFRLVEDEAGRPTDRNGNALAGGVNTFPDVHVLLFVTPQAMTMLNGRVAVGRLAISICPGLSISEWDQSDAIPIYEAVFESR